MTNQVSRLLGLPKDKLGLAHAYIFEGQDLPALQQVANVLIKTILCRQSRLLTEGGCGQCQSCQLVAANTHPDTMTLGMDGNGIGVDEIRHVTQFLEKTSQLSGSQVVVLSHAEAMSENAANALLKTLEEPTRHSYLLLLTESKHRLMATIRSRCQNLRLPTDSRDELKLQYPDLPDYILGYSKHATSLLQSWCEDDTIERFELVYQTFITWLKRNSGEANLANICLKELQDLGFVHYLLERRIRQLFLKGRHEAKGALAILSEFEQSNRMIKGQNKSLALVALLQKLAPLVR